MNAIFFSLFCISILLIASIKYFLKFKSGYQSKTGKTGILLILILLVWTGKSYALPTYVSGTIGSDVWTTSGSPYVITGNVTLSAGETLTIQPGVVVKFELQRQLTIDGTLTADGDPGEHIVFTSIKDDTYGEDTNGDGSGSSPSRNDWNRIYFTSTITANLLDNVIVRYGGNGSVIKANIYVKTPSLTISKSTVENGTNGIYVNGVSISITGSIIRNNSLSGIDLLNSPGTTITGNTITGNGDYAIDLSSGSLDSTSGISGNTITGNGNNGIRLRGGTLSTSATWIPDAPYIIYSDVTVSTGVTLTVQPGGVVKFESGRKLTIDGTLTADGDPGEHIVFTSIKDDTYGGDTNGDGSGSSPSRNDWNRIDFTSTSTANLLDNVIVRYGGNGSVINTNIRVETSSLTISNSTVENGDNGIYINGVSPSITGSVIRNNSLRGIDLINSPDTTILGNSISGNGNYGVYNSTSSIIVNAEYNYWGDSSGPTHSSNPGGIGDRVSDYVDYYPWMDSFPQCIDNDHDGYGSLGNLNCPNGPQADCDDNDDSKHPNQIWYNDFDNDGYTDGNFLVQCERPVGAYKTASQLTGTGDCDDTNLAINPETYWYQDNDGDGFGTSTIYLQQCTKPEGSINYVLNNTDPDDNDPNIYPGGPTVRVNGVALSYHLTLQDAYNAAETDETIEAQAVIFDEPLNINSDISVTLEGGYSNDFRTITGNTTLQGDMSIDEGTLIIENFVIAQ
jgi:parallel beta-helix repeat protein